LQNLSGLTDLGILLHSISNCPPECKCFLLASFQVSHRSGERDTIAEQDVACEIIYLAATSYGTQPRVLLCGHSVNRIKKKGLTQRSSHSDDSLKWRTKRQELNSRRVSRTQAEWQGGQGLFLAWPQSSANTCAWIIDIATLRADDDLIAEPNESRTVALSQSPTGAGLKRWTGGVLPSIREPPKL
jgi:hypothetical protein